VRGQRHAPATLYLTERPGTHCTGGWVGPHGQSGRAENLAPTGIRSPDRPARSQSLYRLSYPSPRCFQCRVQLWVQLYLYQPFVPAWHITGWPLSLHASMSFTLTAVIVTIIWFYKKKKKKKKKKNLKMQWIVLQTRSLVEE